MAAHFWTVILKTHYILLLAALWFFSCDKENAPEKPCTKLIENPAGRTYGCTDVIEVSYTGNYCGFMPISDRTYWVYEDSIFEDGIFKMKRLDTLRFSKKYMTITDNIIWWEADKFLGLPSKLYANDSGIYKLEYRMFSSPCVMDVKKEYYEPEQDFTQYLTSFDDDAAIGRINKLHSPVTVPTGSFEQCISFEKFAPTYRSDKVIIKMGVGVIKFIHQLAPPSDTEIKLQLVSSLVGVYKE